MSKVLLEEINPNGNLQALVECDERVCHLYLCRIDGPDPEVRSVWVRNLIDAPRELDVEGMRAGEAPMNPASDCQSPKAGRSLRQELLRFVWFPEGNGVALYEGDEILAILPPWSGVDGFHGYARDAVGTGPLAWEIGETNVLPKRLDDAQRYWASWDADDAWSAPQEQLLSRASAVFGQQEKYYAIDGGAWPPKALLRFSYGDAVVLMTIGVCLRPQPSTEPGADDPSRPRRIELGAVVPSSWSDNEIVRLGGYLSAQSSFPWTYYAPLGAGHTIRCNGWRNPRYEFAVLSLEHDAVPTPDLGDYWNEPIRVLWFRPMTREEREAVVANDDPRRTPMPPHGRWADA